MMTLHVACRSVAREPPRLVCKSVADFPSGLRVSRESPCTTAPAPPVPASRRWLTRDASLESEADALGARAAAGELVRAGGGAGSAPASPPVQAAPIQCIDQRDEAKLPTSAQQNTLGGHLDPNTRQQQQPQHPPLPWDGELNQPDHDAKQRAMRKEMFVALHDFRAKNDPAVQNGKNARRVPMTRRSTHTATTTRTPPSERSAGRCSARRCTS